MTLHSFSASLSVHGAGPGATPNISTFSFGSITAFDDACPSFRCSAPLHTIATKQTTNAMDWKIQARKRCRIVLA